MFIRSKSLLVIIIVSLLQACGGSTSTSSIPTPLIEQSLVFELIGPLSLIATESISNIAIGQGLGEITYTSSDTSTASVDEFGMVDLLAAGSVRITASISADDEFSPAQTSYTISVRLKPREIVFSEVGPLAVFAGDEIRNPAEIEGPGLTNYKSNDINVATVDSNGVVTVLTSGSVNISASILETNQYEHATASYTINAATKPQSLSFREPGPLSIMAGETIDNPASGLGTGAVIYNSSDNQIATVNNSGLVTILTSGSVIITALKEGDSKFDPANASYTINSTLKPQELSFQQPGPLSVFIGDNISNPASGLGTGIVTYISNNTQVATVDEHGLVSVTNKGEAIITANISEDEQNSSTSNSYTINSTIRDSILNAWVGAENSNITFLNSTDGMEFYRSSEPTCDITNYGACENGRFDILSGENNQSFTDTSLNLQQSAYATFQHGTSQKNINLHAEKPGNRAKHKVINFQGKFWLFGGSTNNGSRNDIWSSNDGVSWVKVSSNAAYPKRTGQQIVPFNDKLLLIGGWGSDGKQNDIWSSSNGGDWVLVKANAEFSARYQHQVISFNDKLWLIGGRDDDGIKNDIWSSSDGENWALVSANGAFSARSDHKLVNFKNKLWLIGSGYSRLNDVWSSDDGEHWVQEVAEADFLGRSDYQVVNHNNKLWLIGGNSSKGKLNDVWSSTDGKTWVEITSSAGFPSISDHQLTSFSSKLLLIGGFNSEIGAIGTWSSLDGLNWKLKSLASAFAPRYNHQLVNFKNKLWLISGYSQKYPASKKYSDIWSSSDGLNWVQESKSAEFPQRSGEQIIEFSGKLWLIGGYYDGEYSNDIWSSSNGVNWVLENESAEVSGRHRHRLAIFQDKLWLIGGLGGDTKSDVWSSENGVNWTQMSVSPSFPRRYDHQIISFADKLWIIGGDTPSSGGSGNDDDIWYSEDGENWTRVTDNAVFGGRHGHQVVKFADKLWLIGGISGCYPGCVTNDIWSSDDGINWTEEKANAEFTGRELHQVVSFSGKLWMTGGKDGDYKSTNRVWSSEDAVNWRQGYQIPISFNE